MENYNMSTNNPTSPNYSIIPKFDKETSKKEGKKLLSTFFGGFWVLCIVATVFTALSTSSPIYILIPCLLTTFTTIIILAFILLAMLILKKNPQPAEKNNA